MFVNSANPNLTIHQSTNYELVFCDFSVETGPTDPTGVYRQYDHILEVSTENEVTVSSFFSIKLTDSLDSELSPDSGFFPLAYGVYFIKYVMEIATFRTLLQNGSSTYLWVPRLCSSHFGNEVCNGAISNTQQVFINDCYKVNPVDQWGIILAIEMGFVDHLGLGLGEKSCCFESKLLCNGRNLTLLKSMLVS